MRDLKGDKPPPPPKKRTPTADQLTAIKAAIQNAGKTTMTLPAHSICAELVETLEEVRQLEAALKSGVMPSQLEQAQTVKVSPKSAHLVNFPSQAITDPEPVSKDAQSHEDEEMPDADE